MSRAKKPNAVNVARWVKDLAAPNHWTPGTDAWHDVMRVRHEARASLRSWGLDANGQPVKAVAS